MNQSLPAPLDVKLMNLTASVLFLCCVLLLLAAGARWVLRYPGFSVARIVVQGELVHNNAVTLRANVAPQLAGNFFTIDLRAARAALRRPGRFRDGLVQLGRRLAVSPRPLATIRHFLQGCWLAEELAGRDVGPGGDAQEAQAQAGGRAGGFAGVEAVDHQRVGEGGVGAADAQPQRAVGLGEAEVLEPGMKQPARARGRGGRHLAFLCWFVGVGAWARPLAWRVMTLK